MNKPTLSLAVLLLIAITALPNSFINARTKSCEHERVERYREGRETVVTPSDPCEGDETNDDLRPPVPTSDLNVIMQDVIGVTHVQPGTGSVPIASLLLDASDSDKNVHLTAVEFIMDMTSYADYSDLENCRLSHDGSAVSVSGIAHGNVTYANNNVATSHGKIAFSLPLGSAMTPSHQNSRLDLLCDFPSSLTEASLTTQIADENFMAVDSDGDEVDYTILPVPGHRIEVYAGDTRPWENQTPPNDEPTPGGDGEDGADGSDADTGGADEPAEDGKPSQGNRPDRPDRGDRN